MTKPKNSQGFSTHLKHGVRDLRALTLKPDHPEGAGRYSSQARRLGDRKEGAPTGAPIFRAAHKVTLTRDRPNI